MLALIFTIHKNIGSKVQNITYTASAPGIRLSSFASAMGAAFGIATPATMTAHIAIARALRVEKKFILLKRRWGQKCCGFLIVEFLEYFDFRVMAFNYIPGTLPFILHKVLLTHILSHRLLNLVSPFSLPISPDTPDLMSSDLKSLTRLCAC